MSNDWSNGLFGCFNDCSTCLISWCVPCYVFGKNAEHVDENCLLCALSQFVPVLNIVARLKIRGKIRDQKGIQGSLISDLLSHCCCGLCALVQEAQEVGAPGGHSMARE